MVPPGASGYPLSKGPQREPHGHLVPPYQSKPGANMGTGSALDVNPRGHTDYNQELEVFATPIAEGIWNDGLESGIRRRASRAARFACSRATLVQNPLKKNGDNARYGQTLPTHARNDQIVPHTGQIRKNKMAITRRSWHLHSSKFVPRNSNYMPEKILIVPRPPKKRKHILDSFLIFWANSIST